MTEQDEIRGWVMGRVPADWYQGTPEIRADRDEVLIVGRLPDVQADAGTSDDVLRAARSARIEQHREETRAARMRVADEAERRFGRKASWGADCGDVRMLFTHLSAPMMTRLRLPERQLLDALVEAGVARSRSHALAWCVKLVAQHQGDWIRELTEAVATVERVRGRGPAMN